MKGYNLGFLTVSTVGCWRCHHVHAYGVNPRPVGPCVFIFLHHDVMGTVLFVAFPVVVQSLHL